MCMHMCMLLGSSLQHVTGKYVAASSCNPGKLLLGGVTMGALRNQLSASPRLRAPAPTRQVIYMYDKPLPYVAYE